MLTARQESVVERGAGGGRTNPDSFQRGESQGLMVTNPTE